MKNTFCIILLSILLCSCNQDTEYLGHYIVQVCYDEPWDEYIHKTCTRTVHNGYDKDGNERTHEETYDCSYVDYHPAKWYYEREDRHTVFISESQYNMICRKFGTPMVFKDMHRHYYRKDGDRYICSFNGDRNHMWTLTSVGSYKNKVLKSKSVFNFSDVSKEDIERYKLYDYPSNFDYFQDQNPILGYNPGIAVIDSFRYINAYYGPKYQFRCYVMVWRNMPIETSKFEQDYLVGGNKNELIVCLSINNSGNIQWVNAFSWEDVPKLEVEINHLYEPNEKFDIMKLNRYLITNVPKKWKRKEFKDFEYINN